MNCHNCGEKQKDAFWSPSSQTHGTAPRTLRLPMATAMKGRRRRQLRFPVAVKTRPRTHFCIQQVCLQFPQIPKKSFHKISQKSNHHKPQINNKTILHAAVSAHKFYCPPQDLCTVSCWWWKNGARLRTWKKTSFMFQELRCYVATRNTMIWSGISSCSSDWNAAAVWSVKICKNWKDMAAEKKWWKMDQLKRKRVTWHCQSRLILCLGRRVACTWRHPISTANVGPCKRLARVSKHQRKMRVTLIWFWNQTCSLLHYICFSPTNEQVALQSGNPVSFRIWVDIMVLQ